LAEEMAGSFGPEILMDGVKSISLSSDGRTLVSGGKGGSIALWS